MKQLITRFSRRFLLPLLVSAGFIIAQPVSTPAQINFGQFVCSQLVAIRASFAGSPLAAVILPIIDAVIAGFGCHVGAPPATLVVRSWTTAGNSSATPDESNPARLTYANSTAAANAGSPAGTYVLRYNIKGVNNLTKGSPTNTRLRVRFRDEGDGSRVTVAIMRTTVNGGEAILGTVFDSNTFTPGTGFQTQEITMPALVFNFSQNAYWLEVTLTKDTTDNQPGFGSAQITQQ